MDVHWYYGLSSSSIPQKSSMILVCISCMFSDDLSEFGISCHIEGRAILYQQQLSVCISAFLSLSLRLLDALRFLDGWNAAWCTAAMSLYCFLWPLHERLPFSNLAHVICLGSLPPSMRTTCQDHLSWFLIITASMHVVFACLNALLVVCQLIPRIATTL